jgi:hypothetical protein
MNILMKDRIIISIFKDKVFGNPLTNKAFLRDKVAVSHLLQKAQKLRHNSFAAEQRRYALVCSVGTE